MELLDAAEKLTALGHPGRLSVFRLLARRAPQHVRPSDISAALDIKRNTLSGYLSTLEDAGIVQSRRDGTSIYYSIDTDETTAFTQFLLADCCRGRPEICAPMTRETSYTSRALSVLFICSGNSARSLMAEVLLRDAAPGRFVTYSAGTQPATGGPNPYVLELLQRSGHDITGLASKPVTQMQAPDAPIFDFVFTVCDDAANEECPSWPGQPMSAHWGLPDPARATGTQAEIALAFAQAYNTLNQRISAFAALPFATLDQLSLQLRIDDIGLSRSTDRPPQKAP